MDIGRRGILQAIGAGAAGGTLILTQTGGGSTDAQATTSNTTATATPTATATDTPTSTATGTDTATQTDTATAEPTATDTQTATQTDTPTETATQTDSPTPTDTATPTDTPTPEPTPTSTPDTRLRVDIEVWSPGRTGESASYLNGGVRNGNPYGVQFKIEATVHDEGGTPVGTVTSKAIKLPPYSDTAEWSIYYEGPRGGHLQDDNAWKTAVTARAVDIRTWRGY